jgi:hypothetical protein
VVPNGQNITGASITILNLRNWDNNPNKLYIDLVNSPLPTSGVQVYTDGEASGDDVAKLSGYVGMNLDTINNWTTTSQPVSGAGEPPPCALSDTDVNLSAHPAPIIQPLVLFIRLCLLHRFLP